MNFDRLAPCYDWMEAVTAGGLLQRARTTWIDGLAECPRVLSVGEGHGKFASAFANRFPAAHLTCVDASKGMLGRARRRASSAGIPIEWVIAEVPAWSPPFHSFDAVVTCFFLDCFPREQLETMIAVLAAAATANATWLVVDFAVPEHGIGRWRARMIHAAMYSFFRVTARLPARRLTPPDEFLHEHNFRLVGRREFSWGLLRADLWRRVSVS